MCEILVSKIVVCAMPYVLVPVFLGRDVIDLDDCVPEIFVMGAFRGCLFCISVSIMFFCLRCRARPPKGVQCLPGHTLGTGRKCKPGPRPTPETRVPQHANFAGGSNPAWTQKWGDMGARKGSPASPPPTKIARMRGGQGATRATENLAKTRNCPVRRTQCNQPRRPRSLAKTKIVPRPTRHDPKGRPRRSGLTGKTSGGRERPAKFAAPPETKNCPGTNAAWPQRATARPRSDQEQNPTDTNGPQRPPRRRKTK